MNSTTKCKSKNPTFILIAFFSILCIPLLLAWFLVQKGSAILPSNHHGNLITPAQNMIEWSFHDLEQNTSVAGGVLRGKWWLVYLSPSRCQQTCHDILYDMRQIRTALGKDAPRLERLLIANNQCDTSICEKFIRENYPEMRRVKIQPHNFSLLTKYSSAEAEIVGALYLIDPQGNLMMYYAADTQPRAILADIKRLLKVSKIG